MWAKEKQRKAQHFWTFFFLFYSVVSDMISIFGHHRHHDHDQIFFEESPFMFFRYWEWSSHKMTCRPFTCNERRQLDVFYMNNLLLSNTSILLCSTSVAKKSTCIGSLIYSTVNRSIASRVCVFCRELCCILLATDYVQSLPSIRHRHCVVRDGGKLNGGCCSALIKLCFAGSTAT